MIKRLSLLLFIFVFVKICFSDCGGRNSGKPIVEVLIWSGGSWAGFDVGEYLSTPNYLGHNVDKKQWDCPIDCRFTSDKTRVGNVDGVIFEAQPVAGYYDEYKRSPPNFPSKHPYQYWINHGYETHIYFNLYGDHGYMDFIDINMTFYGHSQVPITFTCLWGGGNMSDFLLPPPPKPKSGATARTVYAKEFMDYVHVDSFGQCLNNKQLPKEMQFPIYSDHGSSMRNKIKVFREYKFVLTFENNNVTDYVTEKMTNVIQAGSVPIYMGAPNVHPDWTPGENSILRTDDFKSPKHMADHVKYLCDNDEEYMKLFQWKKKGLSPQYQDKLSKCAFYGAECRLCKYLYERRKSLSSEAKVVVDDRINKIHHDYFILGFKGSEYLEVTSSNFLDFSREFTISLWINVLQLDLPILDRKVFSLSLKKIWKKGYLELCINSNQICWTSTHPIQINNWYHVAISFKYKEHSSQSFIRFHINGVPDQSIEIPSLFPNVNHYDNRPLFIGANQQKNQFFVGNMDEISLWSVALDTKTLRDMVWRLPSGLENGLEASWNFDQQPSSVVFDVKKRLNATAHGNPSWVESMTKPLVTVNAC